MVNDGINQGNAQTERMLEQCRERNKQCMKELVEVREELDSEKWRANQYLEDQEKKMLEQYDKFLEDELMKLKLKHKEEAKKNEMTITHQKQEIDRLKRQKENADLRVAIFKWRQSGMFSRFIDELEREYIDKDSFRSLLFEDMRKLFFSTELHCLNNSLK